MAKKAPPSEPEAPTLLTQEETPSEPAEAPAPEGQVTAPPEEGEPAAPVQEAEKPDLRALVAELPEEERDALFEEQYGERVKTVEERAQQSADDRAFHRMQTEQHRQTQANQGLQQTLRNLETVEDENVRAQHIQAYADWYAQGASQQWGQQALDNLREGLGISPAEHDEIVLRLRQQAARDNRAPTFADYAKHVTGERFMPKRQVDKQIQEEVRAQLAEAQGKKIENQPAPVAVGPGEPTNQEAEDDRIIASSSATGEQKRDAFERRFGYRPRNL